MAKNVYEAIIVYDLMDIKDSKKLFSLLLIVTRRPYLNCPPPLLYFRSAKIVLRVRVRAIKYRSQNRKIQF